MTNTLKSFSDNLDLVSTRILAKLNLIELPLVLLRLCILLLIVGGSDVVFLVHGFLLFDLLFNFSLLVSEFISLTLVILQSLDHFLFEVVCKLLCQLHMLRLSILGYGGCT